MPQWYLRYLPIVQGLCHAIQVFTGDSSLVREDAALWCLALVRHRG
jgi:hypothetical protein